MAKVTLSNIAEVLKDPLLSDNYQIEFPAPKSVSGADMKPMVIQVKSAAKPGTNIEQQMSEMFGHTFRYAGRKTFTGTWSVSYQESDDLKITKFIEDWHESIRGTETQIGALKAEYAVKVNFIILNNKDEKMAEYEIRGVWPTAAPELPMDSSAQALEVSVEVSFDTYIRKS